MIGFKLEFEILSVVLLMILYFYHSKLKNQCGYKYLSLMYIMTFVSSVINIASLLYSHIGENVFFGVYNSIICIGCYMWLCYCIERFEFKKKHKDLVRIFSGIFVVVVCLFSVFYIVQPDLFEFYKYTVVWVCLYCFSLVGGLLFFGRDGLVNRKKEERDRVVLFSVPTILMITLPKFINPELLMPITFSMDILLMNILLDTEHEKTVIDRLTELPNRYGMDEKIDEQLEQYKRNKDDSFYVIACDMDDFKTINDTWGHAEGDRALKLIASILTEVCDKNDAMAFRNGGDEFVIITNKSDEEVVDRICTEIKLKIEQSHFRDDFEIKMSMGVALFDGKTTISELMNLADSSLYTIKRQAKRVKNV